MGLCHIYGFTPMIYSSTWRQHLSVPCMALDHVQRFCAALLCVKSDSLHISWPRQRLPAPHSLDLFLILQCHELPPFAHRSVLIDTSL